MTVAIPSLLSFTGSIRPSVFIFSAQLDAQHGKKIVPVEVQNAAFLGIFQNYIKHSIAKQKADSKGQEKKGNPVNGNPQLSEIAIVPVGVEKFKIEGSLQIFNEADRATACNSTEFADQYGKFYDAALARGIFKELATRYALNLISGQWLWRNRLQSSQIEIVISMPSEKKEWRFDANGYADVIWANKVGHLVGAQAQADATELIAAIEKALTKKSRAATTFVVSASLDVLPGVEVYPSQELNMGKSDNDPSRQLFSLLTQDGTRQAALHPQKVGNAIRTIDYVRGSEYAPIAVSAYGTVTRSAAAYRLGTQKNDFYSLFAKIDKITAEMSDPKNVMDEDWVYLTAMFVMGGVFGAKAE